MKKIISYIKHLLNGDIQLVVVFWFYYFFIGLLLYELFLFDKVQDLNIYLILKLVFFYCYNIFIYKSLWSASLKYIGKTVWIYLTRIVIFLDILWLFFLFPLRIFYNEFYIKLVDFIGV